MGAGQPHGGKDVLERARAQEKTMAPTRGDSWQSPPRTGSGREGVLVSRQRCVELASWRWQKAMSVCPQGLGGGRFQQEEA